MKPNLPFNPAASTILHIDLNSAFASIEQLCDPHLRGKPIAVAAYVTPRGCILSPSIQAKKLGIKTGMLVQEGKQLYPDLVVLPTDPPKYRAVHLQLRNLLHEYTNDLTPKSIDEFVLDLSGLASGEKGLLGIAKEIKGRIRDQVGESLTANIGLAPNRYLAKIAAGLHKPDGLDEINVHNFAQAYSTLQLMDLWGIKANNCARLNKQGIQTVMDFYNASAERLQAAFESIVGYYWYRRLHGWEIDDAALGRHSYGNSYTLTIKSTTSEELAPVLMKLVEKTGFRMRKAGYNCRSVHVSLGYRDGSYWDRNMTVNTPLFHSLDIYKVAYEILCRSPHRKPIAKLSEFVFNLQKEEMQQMSLFGDVEKKHRLVDTLDEIRTKYGDFAITPAVMLSAGDLVPDRIGFGNVRELEEMVSGW